MSQRGLFSLALLFSVAAHAAAAFYWAAQTRHDGAGEAGESVIALRIELAALTPEVTPPAPPTEQAAQATPAPPEQPVRTSIRELREPAPRPRNEPAGIPRPSPAPPAFAALPAGDNAPAAEPAVDYAGLTESWRSRVLARIESHKSYPMAARRKRIEGDLHVDLAIDCDGQVEDISVAGAAGILRRAAQRAVQRAAPLPAPPGHLSCPQRLQYAMRYDLQ